MGWVKQQIPADAKVLLWPYFLRDDERPFITLKHAPTKTPMHYRVGKRILTDITDTATFSKFVDAFYRDAMASVSVGLEKNTELTALPLAEYASEERYTSARSLSAY